MADSSTSVQASEHQLLRAWLESDARTMRGLLSRRFRMVIGAAKPVLLDRKSLLEAIGGHWRTDMARLGQTYVREVSGIVVFAAELEIQSRIESREFSGRWWMTDVWRRSGIARRWKLVDRHLARLDGDVELAQAIKRLQLWRQ